MATDTAWGASSGLPEGEFWIENARFGYKPEVGNGQRLIMMLSGKLTDEDGNVIEHEYRFTVGEGWTSADGGKSAVKENGKSDAQFNANSAWAKFFLSAVQLQGVEQVLRSRGTQRDAEVWLGLGFEIQQVPGEFADRENPGQKVKFFTTTPVRYLGEKDVAAKPKASGASKAVEKARAKAAEKEASNGNGSGETDLGAVLADLARNSADHEAFVAAAFELDGVDGTEWEDKVLDADQIFAEARS